MAEKQQKKKIKRNASFTIGAILVIIVLIIFVISLIHMPHDPNLMNLTHKFLRPGEDEMYRLGTDHFGRDILSRLMFGARHVLLVGVVSVAIGAAIGFVLGALAGLLKGLPSQIIMRDTISLHPLEFHHYQLHFEYNSYYSQFHYHSYH